MGKIKLTLILKHKQNNPGKRKIIIGIIALIIAASIALGMRRTFYLSTLGDYFCLLFIWNYSTFFRPANTLRIFWQSNFFIH